MNDDSLRGVARALARRATFPTLLSCALALGCGDGDDASPPSSSPDLRLPPAADVGAGLSAGQIDALLRALSTRQIDTDELALTRLQDASVQSYARMLRSTHLGARPRAAADADEAPALQPGVEATARLRSRIEAARPEEVDAAYLHGQIAVQQADLSLLEGLWERAAKSERSTLESRRAEVQLHLRVAQQLQQSLRDG